MSVQPIGQLDHRSHPLWQTRQLCLDRLANLFRLPGRDDLAQDIPAPLRLPLAFHLPGLPDDLPDAVADGFPGIAREVVPSPRIIVQDRLPQPDPPRLDQIGVVGLSAILAPGAGKITRPLFMIYG